MTVRTPLTRIASIVVVAFLSSAATPIHGQKAPPRCHRRRARACRACRFPLGAAPADRRRSGADGRCRLCDRQGQPERRLLQGHRHRQAEEPDVAEPRVRGQPAGRVESSRAADGRRRLQRHARDRARRLHAAAGERGQPAEAGLRHRRHRRRPQVRRRVRWQLRHGRRGAGKLRQGVGEEGARRRDRDHQEGVRPRARALVFHRRLAGRPRGARCRGPLSG